MLANVFISLTGIFFQYEQMHIMFEGDNSSLGHTFTNVGIEMFELLICFKVQLLIIFISIIFRVTCNNWTPTSGHPLP